MVKAIGHARNDADKQASPSSKGNMSSSAILASIERTKVFFIHTRTRGKLKTRASRQVEYPVTTPVEAEITTPLEAGLASTVEEVNERVQPSSPYNKRIGKTRRSRLDIGRLNQFSLEEELRMRRLQRAMEEKKEEALRKVVGERCVKFEELIDLIENYQFYAITDQESRAVTTTVAELTDQISKLNKKEVEIQGNSFSSKESAISILSRIKSGGDEEPLYHGKLKYAYKHKKSVRHSGIGRRIRDSIYNERIALPKDIMNKKTQKVKKAERAEEKEKQKKADKTETIDR